MDFRYPWVTVSQILQIQQSICQWIDFYQNSEMIAFANSPHFEVLVTLPIFTYLINSNFSISNFSK